MGTWQLAKVGPQHHSSSVKAEMKLSTSGTFSLVDSLPSLLRFSAECPLSTVQMQRLPCMRTEFFAFN